MSFYLVPSVSYQTQQKLKKVTDKAKHKHKKKDKKSDKLDSKLSSPASSTNISVHEHERETTSEDSRAGLNLEPESADGSVSGTRAGTGSRGSVSRHGTVSAHGSGSGQGSVIGSVIGSVTGSVAGQSPGQSPGQELMNPNVLSEQLSALKRSNSSSSLSSNIASKYLAESPTANVQTSYFEAKSPLIQKTDAHSSSVPGSVGSNDNTYHLDVADKRRNSTSTTSSYPRSRHRRNSSLSSSHTNASTKERSKLSTQVDTDSTDDTKVDYAKSSKIFKPQYSMNQNEDYPQFKTIRDLSVLNNFETLHNHFYVPNFQVFRYQNFLDILSSQHNNDPINFANIRYNSITKFILRHSEFVGVDIEEAIKGADIKDFEGVLSYNLLHLRTFMRKLIRIDSNNDDERTEIYSCEELVQANFTNYLRYILNLSSNILSAPPESLNEFQLVHQKFKSIFTRMIKTLHLFQKEETGDELTNTSNAVTYLLQLVTKLSYDYILLEKYHINILTKLSQNSLISSKVLSGLYDGFKKSLSNYKQTNRYESVKVLNYNAYFSCQYSWSMAVSNPFLRVFEMNIFNENPKFVGDVNKYQEMEKSMAKTSFKESDDILYQKYFKKVSFDNYNSFRNMPDSKLVSSHRTFSDDNGTAHKPLNFEFYGGSLASIGTGTFDVVHSRDLLFELTNSNYRTLITEFHRVLKNGGVLEIPIILSGTDTIRTDNSIVGFPRFTKATGSELSEHYDMIPNLAEVLLSTIISIFGEGNVKFSVILLDSSNEITKFLSRDIGLHVAEFIGKSDSFCKKFESEEGKANKDIHFFLPIQATKC